MKSDECGLQIGKERRESSCDYLKYHSVTLLEGLKKPLECWSEQSVYLLPKFKAASSIILI
jgi:hypothetical protein